jgi:hypothetical protein
MKKIYLETNKIIVTEHFVEYYLTLGGKNIVGGNNVNIKIPLRAFLRDTTIIEKDDHYLKEKLEYPMTINLQFNGDIGTEYPYTIYSSFTKINSILSKRTYFKTNDISGDYDKLLSDDKIVLKGSLVRGKKLHDDDEYPGYEFPLLYLYLIN